MNRTKKNISKILRRWNIEHTITEYGDELDIVFNCDCRLTRFILDQIKKVIQGIQEVVYRIYKTVATTFEDTMEFGTISVTGEGILRSAAGEMK